MRRKPQKKKRRHGRRTRVVAYYEGRRPRYQFVPCLSQKVFRPKKKRPGTKKRNTQKPKTRR